MGELWRRVSETLWRRPALWIPVLVADLLGFLLNLAKAPLLRSLIARHQYRSVLGGPPIHGQMSAAGAQGASTMVLVVTWSSYLIRLLLYATALVVTAALVRDLLERTRKPWDQIRAALKRYGAGIVSLSLRALAVYGAAAVVFTLVFNALIAHGHKAVLANGWAQIGAQVLLMAALAVLIAPAAVQVLAGRYAPPAVKQRAQIFAFILAAVALALGTFVSANMRTVRPGNSFGRSLLELTGSWIVALPYVPLFTGITLLATEIYSGNDARLEEETTG